MKIYRLLFCIFIAIGFSSSRMTAQECFPANNAVWNYSVGASDMFSGESREKNIYYTICGDTIVDGNIFNKLYTTLDSVVCGEHLEKFLGCFRQDEQKVFFMPYYKAYSIYPAYFGPEFLLYDFGVSIGDTVYIEYGFRYYFWQHNSYPKDYHHFMDNYRILTVSNIEIENGEKKITLENGWDIWYEGIGSIFGLFNAGRVEVTDGYFFGFSLNCFKHNDAVKYINNPECSKCFCKGFVDIKEKETDRETIKIYPSPTKDILNIAIPKNIDVKSISIYGIDGKIVYKSTHNEKEINLSNIKNGSYIISIEADNKIFTKLIIKE